MRITESQIEALGAFCADMTPLDPDVEIDVPEMPGSVAVSASDDIGEAKSVYITPEGEVVRAVPV